MWVVNSHYYSSAFLRQEWHFESSRQIIIGLRNSHIVLICPILHLPWLWAVHLIKHINMSNICCYTHFNTQRSEKYKTWLDVHTHVPYLLVLSSKPKATFPCMTNGHPSGMGKKAGLASLICSVPGLVSLEVEAAVWTPVLGGQTGDTQLISHRPLSSHRMVITFHPHQPRLDSSQWVVGGGV